jgi:hypothetical protein
MTFFTLADAPFFVGIIALLNSLRLSGNPESLVVLDAGLTSGQRRLLEGHVAIRTVRARPSRPKLCLKPRVHELEPSGVVVLVDTDMLVTSPLGEIAAQAHAGRICAYPDHPYFRDRWFPEWRDMFALQAPMRRQPYVNSGFVAVDVEHWPDFLERWARACDRLPNTTPEIDEPFWAFDQDALNALLMSEYPADALALQPAEEAVGPHDLARVRIVDADTLHCEHRGRRTVLLHYAMRPKAWEGRSWRRVQRDAYLELLPRVLFAPDIAVRLDPRQLPLWLRPSPQGRAARATLSVLHRVTRAVIPRPARERLAAALDRE